MLDIIKKKKAHLIELRTKLKDNNEYFKQCDEFGYIEIHGLSYMTALVILTKQEMIIDEILADYFSQEDEKEYANIHIGKEV